MKTCKKCSRSEPTIIFLSLASSYCLDCYKEEERKTSTILDFYNKIKKNNDENSLKKIIEYAEQLKQWHFEGILELVDGIKNLNQVISICKGQLEKL